MIADGMPVHLWYRGLSKKRKAMVRTLVPQADRGAGGNKGKPKAPKLPGPENGPRLFVDGSRKERSIGVGGACVAVDGQELFTFADRVHTSHLNEFEALAVLRGLELAQRHQLRRLVVITDCLPLLHKLRAEATCHPILARIQALAATFEQVRFHRVRREFNEAADEQARRGRELPHHHAWTPALRSEGSAAAP